MSENIVMALGNIYSNLSFGGGGGGRGGGGGGGIAAKPGGTCTTTCHPRTPCREPVAVSYPRDWSSDR